jgi:uncharacterized membrane protein HdeD (DUF308 family)
MDETKFSHAEKILQWGLLLLGVAEMALGVFTYIKYKDSSLFFAYFLLEGLSKAVLGYSLPFLYKKLREEPAEVEHHEEES